MAGEAQEGPQRSPEQQHKPETETSKVRLSNHSFQSMEMVAGKFLRQRESPTCLFFPFHKFSGWSYAGCSKDMVMYAVLVLKNCILVQERGKLPQQLTIKAF